MQQNNLNSFLKSSINPEETLVGRPHGGIGFIYRNVEGLTFTCPDTDNDRLAIMKISHRQSGRIVLNLIGVYLPHHNGSPEQIALYSDCLDQLHSILEDCTMGPVLIVGDMNAAIPRYFNQSQGWYRYRPYNHHSKLLFDFIVDNNLSVANYEHSQPINYTYESGNNRTYIDHVLVSSYALSEVTGCKILYEMDWNSDHLPLRTQFQVQVPTSLDTSGMNPDYIINPPRFPRINWENKCTRELYAKKVDEIINSNNIDTVLSNCKDVQSGVDALYAAVVDTMHKASSLASSPAPRTKGPRRRPWWSFSCTTARDTCRFWRQLWIAKNRDRNSQVFQIYKHTKKLYRNARRDAMKNFNKTNFNVLSNLFRSGNTKKFWNKVRAYKNSNDNNCDDIDIHSLKNSFEEKFSNTGDCSNSTVSEFESYVKDKYNNLKGVLYNICPFQYHQIVKYIKRLKSGRAPGLDGITPEHIKYSINSKIPEILCSLFNTCVKYGVLPNQFLKSMLLPIIKKPMLNPSLPNNYRPIMLSSVLSKIIEYAILDNTLHEFGDSQYGFTEGRDTKMAIATTVDVINYCQSQGSTVYACTLDAEKAFDAIPHCVLLYKSSEVIANHWWRLLYIWYHNSYATVKWNNKLSNLFKIEKGTRQGGLTSPFLFNVIYQDIIYELSNMSGGIRIGNYAFNVFCYADDILLTSLTVTGLQKLIDLANNRLSDIGLNFNVEKTSCVIFGKNFLLNPRWTLNNSVITVKDKIDYLGATLNDSDVHINNRISKCRKAFYNLQGAGMCSNGVEPRVISYLWKAALQPIILYGNECFPLSSRNVKSCNKLQSKHIKASLGLSKYLRSTPLLTSLTIGNIDDIIKGNTLKLFNAIMNNSARAKHFYMYLIRNPEKYCKDTLYNRSINICSENSLKFVNILFDKSYLKFKCNILRSKSFVHDCLSDSSKYLSCNYNNDNRYLLGLMLKPL